MPDNAQQVPIEVAIVSLRNDLSKTINEANMPMCLVTPIIKDILTECSALEQDQIDKAFEAVKQQEANHTEDQTEQTEVEKVEAEVVD